MTCKCLPWIPGVAITTLDDGFPACCDISSQSQEAMDKSQLSALFSRMLKYVIDACMVEVGCYISQDPLSLQFMDCDLAVGRCSPVQQAYVLLCHT